MVDLLIILAFVAYAIGAGLRARKKASKNLRQYFLAGRTIEGWRAGFSMAATQFAADTPLLVMGLIATGGLFMVWRLWVYGLAFLLMGIVLAAAWRRSGVLTDAELTEVRYSGRGVLFLRVVKAIYYGTVINCVGLAMVLLAAMRIAEIFLPWHQWLPESVYGLFYAPVSRLGLTLGDSVTGLDAAVMTTNNLLSVLLIVAFVALYSTTGGLRSVIATDVAQFTLAIVGTAAYAWVLVDHVGGIGALSERVVELYGNADADRMLSFTPSGQEVLHGFLIVVGLQWLFQMNSDGTGYLAQRSLSCKTDRDARVAAVVFTWLQIVVRSVLWIIIGVGLLIVYPFDAEEAGAEGFAASREILFATGIDEMLPVGVTGLMLVGLLAALASTVDTHLNWGASYWSRDLYERLVCREWLDREPGDRETVLVARLSNVLILVLSLGIMLHLDSIQEAWHISLTFGAGMGAVLVLRWLWERINLFSELSAMAVSLVAAPLLIAYTDQEWVRLGTMALVSTAATIGVTFVTPTTRPQKLEAFYAQVRPMGLWRKTARRAGIEGDRPLQRLKGALGVTALGAVSVFAMLVGLGKLFVRPPDESIGWALAAIALSLALLPLWLKGAFGRDGQAVGLLDIETAESRRAAEAQG
ncbi:MAG: sodium:solute symporter family protein [Persicimonas sp.]